MRLIDADALIKSIDGNPFITDSIKTYVRVSVAEMPTIEERKKGKWRDTGSGQECNICGEIQYGYDTGRHFCANCGADMREQP